MSSLARRTLLCALLAGPFTSIRAATNLPISLVNYSPWPVHATAITLDADDLARRLGHPPGTPLEVRDVNGQLVPLAHDATRIHVFVSVPATSRLDLVASHAERWNEAATVEAAFDAARTNATLRNGVLEFGHSSKGWKLALAGPGTNRPGLIRDGLLEFWVDRQNRGRIANGNPKDMGLRQFSANTHTETFTAAVVEGRPTLRRMSRLDGFARDLVVTETFELVPNQPILNARVTWRNDSDAPLWIAYVGSGDGIRGKWSKDLLPTPLIERKKSPVLGDLNGSETRCAWVGGLCRISMESPATGCGVGLSTLLPTPGKVGQGSMIWGCNGYGFQCNFIDPEQGQFPFLVKPHATLTNGFAFLAAQTGVSVHRQTVALWNALQKEQLPALAPPCAVFVGGEAIHPQTVAALPDRPALWTADGDGREVALRLDLNRFFTAHVAAGTGPVEISARRMPPGKASVILLKTEQAGVQEIDLNRAFAVTDEVAFVLSARGPAVLSVTEILPVAPEIFSPLPDASFTDIATMFRWRAMPSVVDYDLQWSRTADFAAPVAARVTTSDPFPWYLPVERGLPTAGRWFWRLRGVKGDIAGAWSPVRSFTVNEDHTTQPVKRPFTAEHPLFTVEASKVTDFTSFRPDFPADLNAHIGIIAEGYVDKGLTITQFVAGVDHIPNPFMVRSHPPTWVALSDLEWLCQHKTNFLGIQGGETLSTLYAEPRGTNVVNGDADYHRRLLRICAKYGRIYHEADGTYRDDKWQDLMDKQGAFIRQFGPWLVLSQKNNIIRRQFYSQSAALGLWLGGITHQQGAWEDGGFYWQNAGFGELGECKGERSGLLRTMPRIFWDLVFVMGIGHGSGVYCLDGQTLMVSPKEIERYPKEIPRAIIWTTTGETTETFKRFVAPLIRGIVQHRLVPTRDEVLRTVKLAVFNDMKGQGDAQAWTHYVEYGPLFAATYGFRTMGNIDGQLWEFFPNTGRYAFIPALPQGNEPLGPGVRNVPLSELQDMARVRATFDAAYPKSYEGDALVCRVGNTLTVLNSRENEDVTESFAVPLSAGPLTGLSGRIPPHAYIVAKLGTSIWLQANGEYPERAIDLAVGCARKPVWRSEPAAAMQAADWDETARTLKLRLTTAAGAVEVHLE